MSEQESQTGHRILSLVADMPIQPMTLEEAVLSLDSSRMDTDAIRAVLHSYTLHVATVARPEESIDSCNDYRDGANKSIADYFAAIKSEIEKN